MSPKVIEVAARDNFNLFLSFDNGEEKVFDVRPYLDKGVFEELQSLAYFKQVRPFFGGVQWPHEQDFGPDTLYLEARALTDDVAA